MERPYARVLLCAILSDTLALRSPTTTAADRLIVALLSVMAGVDEPDALASKMFKAKTNWIVNLGPTEMVRGDQKDFNSGPWKVREIIWPRWTGLPHASSPSRAMKPSSVALRAAGLSICAHRVLPVAPSSASRCWR